MKVFQNKIICENIITLEDGIERRREQFRGEPLPFESPLGKPVGVWQTFHRR
jgi:hypothetical protein